MQGLLHRAAPLPSQPLRALPSASSESEICFGAYTPPSASGHPSAAGRARRDSAQTPPAGAPGQRALPPPPAGPGRPSFPAGRSAKGSRRKPQAPADTQLSALQLRCAESHVRQTGAAPGLGRRPRRRKEPPRRHRNRPAASLPPPAPARSFTACLPSVRRNTTN